MNRKTSANLTSDDSILEKFSKDNGTTCIRSETVKKDIKYNLKIVIPCFNAEKYIDLCLESLVRQKTHYSFLVVLINDGSTDNTLIKLKKYESENIVIINQPNKGFSGARNSGLNTNESDFVMFIDSDDCLIGDSVIENCLNLAYKCKKNSDDKIIIQFKHSNKYKQGSIRKKVREVNYTKLSGFAWAKLFSSELFDKVCFPLDYWFEDTVLSTIVYPSSNSFYKNNSLIYFYRPNPEGISAKSLSSNKLLDTFYVMNQLLKDRRKLGLPEDIFFIHRFYIQTICNCVRLRLCPQQVQKQVFLKTCELFEYYKISLLKDFKTLYESLTNKDFVLYKRFCLAYSKVYLS